MIDREDVRSIAHAWLSGTECYLVDVTVSTDNRIVVEIDSDESISVDFCADMSRYIESKLDRDKEDFELEVGSTGLTEPFKILRQYQKNIGNDVEVLTANGCKLCGVLVAASEVEFVVSIEKEIKPEGVKRKVRIQEEKHFTYDQIKHTKYLIRFK